MSMLPTRDVVVDGVRLRVADLGRGPVLVLLHGLTASHAIWEHTIAAFAGGWRVIAPDLPGHGASAKPDAPYTIDFYAGIVRSLGRALDVQEAVVVGSSLGGQVALELALGYPSWTRALVLAAPAFAYPPAFRPFGHVIQALTGQRVLRAALEQGLMQTFHDRATAGHEVTRRLLQERLADPDFPSFARAVARSLGGVLTCEPQALERIAQPVLLAWGREDRLVRLARSTTLQSQIPHARLAVFDACGHLPMLEQPTEFNRAVADFLALVLAAPRVAAGAAAGGA